MPQVISPEGVPMNVPHTLNGEELRGTFNIPENQIVTRADKTGKEEVVRSQDTVQLQDGDRIDTVTSFERGAVS